MIQNIEYKSVAGINNCNLCSKSVIHAFYIQADKDIVICNDCLSKIKDYSETLQYEWQWICKYKNESNFFLTHVYFSSQEDVEKACYSFLQLAIKYEPSKRLKSKTKTESRVPNYN